MTPFLVSTHCAKWTPYFGVKIIGVIVTLKIVSRWHQVWSYGRALVLPLHFMQYTHHHASMQLYTPFHIIQIVSNSNTSQLYAHVKYNIIIAQHDIVILSLIYVTVYTHISKQSMMWIQNLKLEGDKVTWTRRIWLLISITLLRLYLHMDCWWNNRIRCALTRVVRMIMYLEHGNMYTDNVNGM